MLLIKHSLSGTYRLKVEKWISYPMQMKTKESRESHRVSDKTLFRCSKGTRSFKKEAVNLEGENTNSKYTCIQRQSIQIQGKF